MLSSAGRRVLCVVSFCWLATFFAWGGVSVVHAASRPLVPGTGQKLENVGDDFEDPDWAYIFNGPKSSREQDGRARPPMGRSKNGRWFEGPGRGHPDLIRRVPTPPDGLEGSQGALMLATRYSGVLKRPSRENGQDDLFMHVAHRVGGVIPVSQGPSAVVRVFVPPFDRWENRTGASFGFRTTVRGINPKSGEREAIWPGLFFHFNSQTSRRVAEDSAYLIVRAGPRGNDYRGPKVEPGWWTLGMSFTPDGRVHFYASPGVDDLTEDDRIGSHYCYGYRCVQFKDVFFDVFNANNGRNWSTAWIIDDPAVYVARPRRRHIARRR